MVGRSVELDEAVGLLANFLGRAPLTSTIARLERTLDGADARDADAIVGDLAISSDLLHAAVVTRGNLGRINDLIHALGISLMLPVILEDGETITNRPSLAAGNDPSRPYDLETDRRVAEFKFSVWTGRDAMRKRNTFKDYVHLAADESGRRPVLYVLGARPFRFLRTTRSSAAWGLDRSPATRTLFAKRFGDPDISIGAFVTEHQARVEVVDMQQLAPSIFPADRPTR